MESVMYDLANTLGFNFEATTFPELIYFVVLAICGTSVLAGIIKILFFITFNTRRLSK